MLDDSMTDIHKKLLASGLVKKIKPPAERPILERKLIQIKGKPLLERKLIQIKGKPLSETIIEDRR